jgi:isoaspartyl peptidase/L-asparaginase-like protein (Ntn-hydrolase superfamily)
MENTDHHLLVGHDARTFARQMGFTVEDDLNTPNSRRLWLEWKRRVDPSHFLDPADTSVGFGGLPNAEGVVSLDASVMHGPRKRAGAVAALEGVRTPSLVAKAVMENTDHHLLVGESTKTDSISRWALKLAERRGYWRAVVAIAAKNARMAWAVLRRGEAFALPA